MQPLGYGQCDLGTNSSTIFCATQHAETGRLYADFGLPATCNGEVVRWEFCYTVMSRAPAHKSSQNSITMVVLRPDIQTQVFHVRNVYSINVAVPPDRSVSDEEYPTFCDFIGTVDVSIIHQGDLLGFVCGERVRILFTSAPQGRSSCRNMLRVYNISTQRATNGMASALLSGVQAIQADQFEWINQPVTPLIRVIMSKSIILSNNLIIKANNYIIICERACMVINA